MRTFGDLAIMLNRSTVYLAGLRKRFELPVYEGEGYSDSYLVFLRKITSLRTLNVSEETLLDLWQLEKKLLQLLHADSAGSPTWFLDSCIHTKHPERRLLLTNYDLGVPLTGGEVQIGLNFAATAPELFAGREMGEDALRVLRECLKLRARILDEVADELPHVRCIIQWAAKLR
jgi:hypothetical protein